MTFSKGSNDVKTEISKNNIRAYINLEDKYKG